MAVMALAKIYPRMLRFCKQQMPVSLKPSLKNVTSNFKDHLPITNNQGYPNIPQTQGATEVNAPIAPLATTSLT